MVKNIFGILLIASALRGQSPKFEVASVKASQTRPSEISPSHLGVHIDGTRVEIGLGNMMLFLTMAYKVETYQITGPDWMTTERFDILAKIPEGATKDQVPEMLQALLAERFKLAVHRESREHLVYALTAGKDGPNLKEADPDLGPSEKPYRNGPGERTPVVVLPTPTGSWTYSMLHGHMIFEAESITMPELALRLMPYVDVPVVDTTGLKGHYQVAIDVPGGPNYGRQAGRRGMASDATGRPSEEPSDPSGVSIFAAVQKLGLSLEKRRAPVEHIVVDHIEKAPTAN
jgi:uncharacterized protein (TIGR03435 family)